MGRPKLNLESRLQNGIDATGECWIWKGYVNRYPRIGVDGKMLKVSRIMYELTYGKIPEGLLCCHKCDNPACVNPEHLFLGTTKDNVQDKLKKGRQRGENIGPLKLYEADVIQIKKRLKNGDTQRGIARDYPVSSTTIRDIDLGKTWRHI